MRKLTCTLIGVVMITAGCAVNPPANNNDVKTRGKHRTVFQLRAPMNNITQATQYRLGYGDEIEVKFFNNPEYNETITVRPDGRISMQRVGEIYVIDMTPSELDDIITQTFGEILINPDVTVFVREFGGQNIYVMGQVEKPGVIELTKGMTMLRAIAAAGGPKGGAELGSVLLIRNDGHNRGEAIRVDLELSTLRKNLNHDLPLQSYDVVYVPHTFIADVSSFVTQLYDIALPPFDIWSRYTYWYGSKN